MAASGFAACVPSPTQDLDFNAKEARVDAFINDPDVGSVSVDEMAADGVRALCRRWELELVDKLNVLEALINDPEFGARLGAEDVIQCTDRWYVKATDYFMSLALLHATCKNGERTKAKMAIWLKTFYELITENERLRCELQAFVPQWRDRLGNGVGDGDLDGNVLAWVTMTNLHREIVELHNGFNQLRLEVVKEKGTAESLHWSTGTATVGGVKLQKFESLIVQHINDVKWLVAAYGKCNKVTDAHYQRYNDCKKEVILVQDQKLKDAQEREKCMKDREARMMSMIEDLSRCVTPEALAALRAEMSASDGI